MNYQAMYIKWRPKNLKEIIGQEQIVSAISNSLSMKKIHHAWLFFGNRGIGKTSIARILVKNLNCEKKITNNPCEKCKNCENISKGNFLDLIEIDGASHTKVEDIKELLKYIQYPPIKGRFKIYLIDEIHMLSKHSFNALLKYLEEPPKYVKFILATTNIEKIPKTILSRCLMFNLRPISEIKIYKKIVEILKIEKISFEKKAIKNISRFSEGSLRDALCSIENAISIGNGSISNTIVNNMLGILNEDYSIKIIIYLLKKDPISLIKIIEKISEFGIEWEQILTSLLKILYYIFISQSYPLIWEDQEFTKEQKKKLIKVANKTSQLKIKKIYNKIIIGKKDIKLAPTKKISVEMTLLSVILL
ncbi:DNA polymerase III subunit tau, partial [isoform gamma] [Buchnera aphidicola (Tetraneura ulmi)]|uniref:DNA polymerase III subunit gamma/tau n=1 Tax=Buchnera aphidicola TaxID=9 RepID=UPI0034639495